jgi:iron-sulfur cluster assembly protein
LTDNAIARIKDLIGDNEEYVGVKLGVRRRGCNGYSYTMNYATMEETTSKKFDVVKAEDVFVLVDPKAVFFVVGTVMDYEVSIRSIVRKTISIEPQS